MSIDNYDDIIDSRDVIARIEELESEQEDAMGGFEHVEDMDDATRRAFLDWEADNAHELDSLRALASEGESFPDWTHGETLIRDSYFKEYAQELAEDIGAINADASWPNNCIDWDQAARELRMDYSSIGFDGTDYWIRS